MKYKKILGCLLISLLVTGGNVSATETIPPNVKLEGNADGIVFIDGDKPFLSGENMVPGDSVNRIMEIENNYDIPIQLYMKAVVVTPKDDPKFLDLLKLTITYNDKVIYNGNATGEDGLQDNIDLGSYKPGERGKLVANVVLDGSETDNEYKNKHLEVDWIFTARNNAPQVDEGGNPSKTSDKNNAVEYSLALLAGGLTLAYVTISAKKEGGVTSEKAKKN